MNKNTTSFFTDKGLTDLLACREDVDMTIIHFLIGTSLMGLDSLWFWYVKSVFWYPLFVELILVQSIRVYCTHTVKTLLV